MSQRMLAERSGVNHSTISRLISSGRKPSMATMARLADALGATLPTFLRPNQMAGPLDVQIRAALVGLGVEAADAEELVAVYRRRRLPDRLAG
jgi:transcriptional regulator with XRE-family HTH domain